MPITSLSMKSIREILTRSDRESAQGEMTVRQRCLQLAPPKLRPDVAPLVTSTPPSMKSTHKILAKIHWTKCGNKYKLMMYKWLLEHLLGQSVSMTVRWHHLAPGSGWYHHHLTIISASMKLDDVLSHQVLSWCRNVIARVSCDCKVVPPGTYSGTPGARWDNSATIISSPSMKLYDQVTHRWVTVWASCGCKVVPPGTCAGAT